MTKLLLTIMAAATVVGLLYFRHAQRAQLERLRAANSTLEETVARAETAEQRSEKFKRELLQLEAAQLMRSAVKDATKTSSTGTAEEHPAVKLFRDPEMRAAMKREQLHGVEQNVKRIVDSNLVELLNLTPEQAAALKDLVRKKHAPGADLFMGLMSSGATELAAIGHAAQRERNEADGEIRSFLGESGYQAYDAYEDSLQERTQLSRLQREFDKTGLTLTAEQQASLLQAMIEERQNFQFANNFHDPMSFDMDRLPEIFGEASLNQFMSETEQLNNRIILRAQELLGPQQSGEFAQALRNHFERSKVTVRMTHALFPVGGRR